MLEFTEKALHGSTKMEEPQIHACMCLLQLKALVMT